MIRTRSQLIRLLTNLAEIEHNLCCMYIFAALTLKTSPEEEITWAQLECGRRWARTLLLIARGEMGHLGLICNLLSAIGGTPHLWRPDFPYSHNVQSSGVASFELRPLTMETVDLLVRWETGESPSDLHEAKEAIGVRPYTDDYQAIGQMYRDVRNAVETIDERSLFVGSPRLQAAIDFPSAVTLWRIHDRAAAVRAIDTICDEGQGRGDSHYARLIQLRSELVEQLNKDQNFVPARPVACNPRLYGGRDGSTVVTDANTRSVMELFNDAYLTTLLLLSCQWANTAYTREELALLGSIAYFPLMTMIIRPLAEILSTLPVGQDLPGTLAGPSFELPHQVELPADKQVAWTRLGELLGQLSGSCKQLADGNILGERGRFMQGNLARIESNFRRAVRS
jgi:hypothetical protein